MKPAFKPYEIVRVQEEGYSYFGEALSFPTPEETIMVRRAAGHPGTLIEVPVSKVCHAGLIKPLYTHYAKITGMTKDVDGRKIMPRFPVDMLRYDSCAPVNFTFEEDQWGDKTVAVLDSTFGLPDFMVARVAGRNWEFTRARWSSFMFGCSAAGMEKIE